MNKFRSTYMTMSTRCMISSTSGYGIMSSIECGCERLLCT